MSDSRSELWKQIAPEVAEALADLEGFRAPAGINGRLAHWSPSEKSLRWFLSYLQLAANSTPTAQREIVRRAGRINLGDPVTVTVARLASDDLEFSANLDYLLAAEEVDFLTERLDAGDMRSICELGGGFGRTAHCLLTSWSGIEEYVIVDLPETLALCHAYLQTVLAPDLFKKMKFVEPSEATTNPRKWDLFIQIDGFQEMSETAIADYLENLANPSQFSFISNPVGKYLPSTAGVEGLNPEGLRAVMSLGRSQGIVNPWDELTLDPVRASHIQNYQPPSHYVLDAQPSRLRPHYLHVMYSGANRRSAHCPHPEQSTSPQANR